MKNFILALTSFMMTVLFLSQVALAQTGDEEWENRAAPPADPRDLSYTRSDEGSFNMGTKDDPNCCKPHLAGRILTKDRENKIIKNQPSRSGDSPSQQQNVDQ